MTYRELDERSNRFARHLQACGTGSEDIVAIMMDRSADLITAILGVMKAGAAFLPIDPETPEERIRYSLEDSGTKLLVVNERNMTAAAVYKGKTVVMEDGEWQNESADRLETEPGFDQLAYIIYTSGTTGKPKGVQLEHRNLINYVHGSAVKPV
ncbi:AMP-binding protein [Bacillus velezensis]|nr:AMP-binding protein [Bacillus velezensis]